MCDAFRNIDNQGLSLDDGEIVCFTDSDTGSDEEDISEGEPELHVGGSARPVLPMKGMGNGTCT